MQLFFLHLKRMDRYLLGASTLLVGIGLLMIYSTTITSPLRDVLLPRQVFAAVAGFTLLLLVSTVNYRIFERYATVLYVFSIVLLIGVLVAGTVVKGSSRWFELGFVRFQPVEIAKIALTVFLASWLKTKINMVRDWRYFFLSGLFALVPMVLTILQPDLGSALVLGFIWLAMISAAKPKLKHLAVLFLVVCLTSVAAWVFGLQDYQKNRIETFLNPASDPSGQGYNAIQAITAVGSGGFAGRGFARGVVSQLRFLPERQTDFIFASMGEEMGFLGSVLLLTILLVWYVRMVRIIEKAPENFGFFLSFGLFAYLFFQSAVNIAMNIGLLPITGIPLPLVSYGGSSLLVSLIAVGILQSLHIRAVSARYAS